MGFFSTDKTAKREAARAQQEEAARQARIKQGTAAIDSTFASFGDSFFNNFARDVERAQLPQVNQDYARTQGDLSFNLAGRGLLNSSVRDQREASLAEELTKTKRNLADAGLSQANKLRMDVEDARSRSYNQLLQSADPGQATATATREASSLSKPSPIGPVGSFFGDWSSIYLQNKAAKIGDPTVTPMFSVGANNSSRVIGS
jgi:hypothetical protein